MSFLTALIFWMGAVGVAALILPWVAYPLIIGLLARFFPDPRPVESGLPTVSVVIATRDVPGILRRRVKHLFRTRYPLDRLQVVISVDDAGRHPKAEYDRIFADQSGVIVVRGNTPGGKAATLNAGVALATGRILIFTDSRQRFANDAIPELVGAFSDPRVGAASGNLVLRRGRSGTSLFEVYWAIERWIREKEARIDSCVGVTGAISAMRSELWNPLPSGLILDDVFTPMRLVLEGHRVIFVRSAVAFETRRPTSSEEHSRKTRTLTGIIQLCAWEPSVLLPWRNRLFLQFLCHKLLRLTTPYAVLLVFTTLVTLVVLHFPTCFIGTVIVMSGILVGIAIFRPSLGRRMRAVSVELILTQLAVIRATLNGFRGRWDVWT